jgi:LysM repeat protein
MKKGIILIALCFHWVAVNSQDTGSRILDTVETQDGPIIIYKNHTWEFLDNEPVMMSPEDDSTGIFRHEWINDRVFAKMAERDSIRDTVIILTSTGRPFTMPFYGRLYRGFTYSHKGLDICLVRGDSVRAAFDGVVRYAKYNRGGFGNLIILRHFNGLETYYAHQSKILVVTNQVVSAGDIIGLGGSTGRSRSPHLHFEVRYKDVPLDPLRIIDYDNRKLTTNTLEITKKVFYPVDHIENSVYYKIRKGDTLGRISAKYHTSVKEICAMNKMKPNKVLRVGSTIRVK